MEQEKLFFESRIEAEIKENLIEVKTRNIRQFSLFLSNGLLPYGKITLLIDGEKFSHTFTINKEFTFFKKGAEFQMGKIIHPPMRKSPEFYGPIKQAYFSPFVLVYGTGGDSLTTEITLHQARLEAARWWRFANGFTEILPDTEVTPEVMKDYNLILFGGPKENSITTKINKSLPIKTDGQKVFFGKKEISGDGIAIEYIYPNPSNPNKFVFVHQGTGLDGLKLSTFFNAIYSGAGLPDFIIFDDDVKYKGWGGVQGAGFFDSNWKIDPRLYYLQE